ncbi:PP2C family protein-serine/threonine phosphatase [Pseudonocardia alaniniphila]|uniref:SpoIIE family protein phosphatase n=1 Tax=Pseudonocardia alaniniphila TaxID=75291 RepID=A0ABS9TH14_9PSEU|nr:GAF domain-containing SpoIIE family protein phosphatase [Pseudonocardia alaniniphila]MCH6167824.1 SpoIIE family protein phosphatase [Pseudonocardia alaniniphila]
MGADDEQARIAPVQDAGDLDRLAAVARYEILDAPPDGAFDRIAALAARWFHAPIATVTIVDKDRVWLTAAHGLEGVRQLGPEPALCASAVLPKAPYVVSDVLLDPRASDNPLVRAAMGVRFYAAAPIVTRDGHRLGTINVLDVEPREVTAAGLAALQDLAEIVMDQLEQRLSALRTVRAERQLRRQADEHRAEIEQFAGTLQRTLLPPALPEVPGLELACHYHTASARDVGGDFYDVFALPDGRWAFFLGDVCGHGAPAAALTSMTRYSLRAAALHDPDPIRVLSEVNGVLLQDPATENRFATVIYGIVEEDAGVPDGVLVTLGTGGHEPPLRLRAGKQGLDVGCTSAVEAGPRRVGMLVGAVPDAYFMTWRLTLRPGETLLLYTDGLTDTAVGGEQLGQDGVARLLSKGRGCAAADVVRDLVANIAGFDPPPRDDIALLALGVPGG